VCSLRSFPKRRLFRGLKRTTKITRYSSQKSLDFWKDVKMGPPDPILGLNVAFNSDTNPKKVNLGVGAYRDDNGKPYILESVREAEKRIFNAKMDHEYAGIGGNNDFTSATAKLLFGEDSEPLKKDEIVSVQAISGTGALRLGANFMRKFLSQKNVYMPDPTWKNHIPIFKDAGFEVSFYKYYDGVGGLDFSGLKSDILKAPDHSIFLFHVCAHNPTGIDPTIEQWKELSKICLQKQHFIFFDAAYQGFATGNVPHDAFALRHFIKDGHFPVVCQSFAKNFGLYGERIGALHFVASSSQQKKILDSQIKITIRPMYSNPPIYGARLVSTILNDKELSTLWYKEVKIMADRIISCRKSLVNELKKVGSKRNWDHIVSQIGMFCYTGLKPDQVAKLIKDYHIYLTEDGRISMAGVNSKNVGYIAECIKKVSE